MKDWLATVAACAGVSVVGWPWSAVLPGELIPIPGRLGLAYLCGTALTTLGLLFTTSAGLAFGRPALVLAGGLPWVAGAILVHRRELPRSATVPGPFRLAIPLLVVAIAALALGTVNAVRFDAPTHIDFMNTWGLKAKAAFVDGNLDFAHLGHRWLHYPLNVPNLYATSFVIRGHVDESLLRLPGDVFGIALAGVLWGFGRRMMPPVAAAGAVALAVVTPVYATSMSVGLADLPLAAYLTVSVIAAYLWVLEGDAGWAALSGFAAGAGAWTKVEGVPLALVVLLVALVYRRPWRLREIAHWIGWFAIFTLPWQAFMLVHDIPGSARHFTVRHTDLGVIVLDVGRQLTSVSTWGVFWLVCLGVIATTAPYWWRTRCQILAALVLPNVVLTMAAWVTTVNTCVPCSIRGIGDRLYLHVAPSVALLTAVALTEYADATRARAGPLVHGPNDVATAPGPSCSSFRLPSGHRVIARMAAVRAATARSATGSTPTMSASSVSSRSHGVPGDEHHVHGHRSAISRAAAPGSRRAVSRARSALTDAMTGRSSLARSSNRPS